MEDDNFQSLRNYNIPVVFLDRVQNDKKNASKVVVDDQKAAERATISLLETGIQRVIGFFGNENLQICQKRRQGFYRQCEAYKISPKDIQAYYCENSGETRTILLDSIQTYGPPEGIFAMSDETLIGVMQAIYELDLKVPEQVSIVAISDGEFPEFFNPKITYVETSGYKIGKAAAELLMKLIENENKYSEQIIIDTPLIQRASIRH